MLHRVRCILCLTGVSCIGGFAVNEEYFSIEKAAERLGVSSATVRRRIKKGELQAIKKHGPYGDQYYIPAEEIKTAQMITNVVPVVNQLNAMELAETISAAIRRENEELHKELRDLRQELAELKMRMEDREEERDLRLIGKLREALEQKKQPWWKRLLR